MKWLVCWPDQSPATFSGPQSLEALRASHLFLKCSEFPLFSLSFQPLPLLLLGSKPCFLLQADTKRWNPCQPRGAFYQQSASQCDRRASGLPCSLSFLSSSSFFSCAFWALVSFLWGGKEKGLSVKHTSVKEWQQWLSSWRRSTAVCLRLAARILCTTCLHYLDDCDYVLTRLFYLPFFSWATIVHKRKRQKDFRS